MIYKKNGFNDRLVYISSNNIVRSLETDRVIQIN